MSSLVRALWMLAGVAAAGFLVWIATRPHDQATAGYWATLGILAGAGLALALIETVSMWRTHGRPRLSLPVLLLCFVPALIAAGWIMVAGQPNANWFQRHFDSWSGQIGIRGVVDDVRAYVAVLAFGLGLLLGFSVEPAARRREESLELTGPTMYRAKAPEPTANGAQSERTKAA